MKQTTYYHFLYKNDEDPSLTPHEKIYIRNVPPQMLQVYSWDPSLTPQEKIENVAPQMLQLYPWDFTRVLTKNETSTLFGALEISVDEAFNHLFKSMEGEICVMRGMRHKEQLPLAVWDMDTGTSHTVMLKRWGEDRFYMQSGWVSEFVLRRDLREGMVIGMYWDTITKSIRFSVIKTEALK